MLNVIETHHQTGHLTYRCRPVLCTQNRFDQNYSTRQVQCWLLRAIGLIKRIVWIKLFVCLFVWNNRKQKRKNTYKSE